MEPDNQSPRQDDQQYVPGSHVTAAPQTSNDNYDPQLRAQYANEPKVVHATRQLDIEPMSASERNQKLSGESRLKYPHLNLSDGEFIVLDIKRHPIGLLMPVLMTGIALLATIAVLVLYPAGGIEGLPSFETILIPVLIIMLLIGMGGFIAIWVYLQNQFYMSNESVIQEIQHSLFSRHEQTVSLGSIEDASFKQNGILQTVLNYGTIRLSTEGEETTYRFQYVSDPRKQVAILNNAIESFKNGRPVDPYES